MSNHILKTVRENIDTIVVDWGKEVSFGVCSEMITSNYL